MYIPVFYNGKQKGGKDVNEAEKDLIDRLKGFTVPELCDGMGLYHAMDHEIYYPEEEREKLSHTAFWKSASP